MASSIWDVVIVGAGPAGTSAACAAAQSGSSVLLLDRSELPRYKLCGGGLVGASLAALPRGFEPPIEDSVTRFTFTNQFTSEHERRSGSAVMHTVDRSSFDCALAMFARSLGVTLAERTIVRSVAVHAFHVDVETTEGCIKARSVIGADGATSVIARALGAEFGQVDFGYEAEIAPTPSVLEPWRGRVHVDWSSVSGSYGWIFPKRHHLSVGVIVNQRDALSARGYLSNLIMRHNLQDVTPSRLQGHKTRCRLGNSVLAVPRVFLAGDAAGLLEPWMREGISYALRSGALAGRFAAMTSADGDAVTHASEYAETIRRDMGRQMAVGVKFLDVFAKWPGLAHHLITRTERGWNAFERLTQGETTLADAYARRGVPFVMNLLAGGFGLVRK